MAKVKISELPFCGSPLATGLVPFSQCGVTYSTNICSLGTASPMVAGSGCCSIQGNGCSNNAIGNCSFVGGGACNTVCGEGSSILSGCRNTIFGVHSSIANGCCNTVCFCNSFISGSNNITCTNFTGVFGCNLTNNQPCTFMANNFVVGNFIGCNGCTLALDVNGKMCIGAGGGSSPMVAGTGTCSIKGNGCNNLANADFSFVGGGCNNTTCGSVVSFVGGGFRNTISTTTSGNYGANNTIVGGRCNCICGGDVYGNVIVGGSSNTMCAVNIDRSFIGGGTNNRICCGATSGGAIVAGNTNRICGGNGTFIGAGDSNSIAECSDYGFIGAGYANCICGCYATIVNGVDNCAIGRFSFIGNGGCFSCVNSAIGDFSFIGNGLCNTIACNGNSSSIINGFSNSVSGCCSSVLGGTSNTTFGSQSSVVGGFCNQICCDVCAIAQIGGTNCSTYSGSYYVISGGDYTSSFSGYNPNNFIVNQGSGNCNVTWCSFTLNYDSGTNSTCSGGFFLCGSVSIGTPFTTCGTVISPQSSIIGGGQCNTICGINSFIGGGQGNISLCNFTGVFGCNLCNTQPCTFMANNFVIGNFVGCSGCSLALDANGKMCIGAGGGSSPMVAGTGTCSIQGSGCNNNACGNFSFVGGGCNNIATAVETFIGGGLCNNVCAGLSSILGGCNNTISLLGCCSVIAGGHSHSVGSRDSAIVGGHCNAISSTGCCSFIGGGFCNRVCANDSAVVGGSSNIAQCNFTGVFGCNLCNTQPCTFMANNFVIGDFVGCGGCSLALDCNGKMCIGSGGGAVMVAGIGCCSIKGNVGNNSACGDCSFVGGGGGTSGFENRAFCPWSVVVGGNSNTSCGCNSTISGGYFNAVCGCCSSIVGGKRNCIIGTSNYSFIGGGNCSTASGNYSSILGGFCNNVCGCHSAILGGLCNTVSGNYSAAFGCGLSATAACTFYVNNLTTTCNIGVGGAPNSKLTILQSSDSVTNGVRLYRANGSDWQEFYMGSGFGALSDTLNFYSSFSARNVAAIDRSGMIASITAGADANYLPSFISVYTGNTNESNAILSAVSSTAAQSGFRFDVSDGGGSTNRTASMYINRASVTVVGSLSKGSGSFKIDHPLDSMKDTHHLVHSFVEAPKADLIYRGKITLVNGKGQANIDEIATMTEGTFELLCRDIQCFTTNESGWDLVKGKVIGNILHIESQNENSIDEISWLVIGERKDKHMMETEWTDENGKVIVEPLKLLKETI